MATIKEISKALKPFGYTMTVIAPMFPIKKGKVDYDCPKSEQREFLQYFGHNRVVRLFCPKRFSDLPLAQILKQILTDTEFNSWTEHS